MPVTMPSLSSATAVLWGKTEGEDWGLLLQHLLDTAAVAEALWDHFLADSVRRPLDDCTDGRGRQLVALLGGWHDLGKATPGFQAKVPRLAAAVDAVGLRTIPETTNQRWRHERASACIAMELLRERWPLQHVDWFWPLLLGHHGVVLGADALEPPGRMRGDDRWAQVQHALALHVAAEIGFDLDEPPHAIPSRGRQLAMLGHLIMADWVASNTAVCGLVDDPRTVSLACARSRADAAVKTLRLARGLRFPSPGSDPVRTRFGVPTRPAQSLVVEMAREMSHPGLLVVEAPMGEGKTEAALLAAEALGARFGQDGVFVGLPTQATTDAMYTRVRHWVEALGQDVPVGLLHGKRRLNREWRELSHGTSFARVGDDYDLDDPYVSPPAGPARSAQAERPDEWFTAAKRGLLAPITVGTVDQLLHAGTRTRHVMLRHAGLGASVVILDEVHAYDVYMSEFLQEVLRWLASAQVPVVLLSATLPSDARRRVVRAYLQGAHGRSRPSVPDVTTAPGYPSVLAVSSSSSEGEGHVDVRWRAAAPWRPSRATRVSLLDGAGEDDVDRVAALLRERLADGGTCLVVHNTVRRAQATYRAVREVFPGQVRLLHARLTSGRRADLTDELVEALGAPRPGRRRPERLVIVATQVAEQSFDVDADLLVTDLAPIDLLLQRTGRLHRHARPPEERPAGLREPEVVVLGVERVTEEPPRLERGAVTVYGERLLLRAAHLVHQAVASRSWSLPNDVPGLVRSGYEDAEPLPEPWRRAYEEAQRHWQESQRHRRDRAVAYLLAGPHRLEARTLEGLHSQRIADLDSDDAVAAVVRDGEPSVEVVLVVRGDIGYRTLSGRRLGHQGEAVLTDVDLLEEVQASTVRLPATPVTRSLTAAAERDLRPLEGWRDEPYFRHAHALVLDSAGSARVGDWIVTYDEELGLEVTRG